MADGGNMRPFETGLFGVLIVAHGLSILPGRPGWRWAAVACVLAALVQAAVEGWRWQLIPAYAITSVWAGAALASMTGWASPGAGPGWGRVVALSVSAGVTLASLALAFLLPVFRFPTPTGSLGIGTLTYDWVDDARDETFTSDPADRRELMVQVWYPARVEPSAPRAPYIPDGAVLEPLSGLLGLPGFSLGHLSLVTTNAVSHAPIVAEGVRYPVLIFSHGRGGYRQHNTALFEELVSHGYVVVSIDHPYAASGVAFPDGRVVAFDPRMRERAFVNASIPILAQDVLFVLRRLADVDARDPSGVLTGRLDLDSVGMFGLSLGGETTAEACRLEPRLRACLMMDVWMPPDVIAAGLDQPALWMTRDEASMQREGWAQADIDETLSTMRVVYAESRNASYFVTVPGMFHQDFSDGPLLSPLLKPIGLSGPIDPDRARKIVAAYTLAFFDRHVRGLTAPLLDGPSAEYPEVQLETRQP